MWTKIFGAIALTGLLAVGANISAGMTGVKVTPLKPNNDLPTFADVQEQARTGNPNAKAAPLGPEPWAGSERYAKSVRESAREQALRSLVDKRGRGCEKNPRDRLASGIGYYLEQRAMQERGYAASWGPEGAKFISTAWATPDDRKIEQLMREAYIAGEFNLDELNSKRPFAEGLVGNAKPVKIRC